jgi:probable rRNA maturation factor
MKGLPAVTVQRVVAAVLRAEHRAAEVAVTFLGPTRMRALNRGHLGHDRATDVISFALTSPQGGLVGDVYICRSVAAQHAKRLGVPLRQELVRLVVHGTLHVLGYDHPDGDSRTASPMWRRQERYVRRFA